MPLIRNSGTLVIRCFKSVEHCADRLTGAAGPVFVAICWVLIVLGGISFGENVHPVECEGDSLRYLSMPHNRISRCPPLPQAIHAPPTMLRPRCCAHPAQPLLAIPLRHSNTSREPSFGGRGDQAGSSLDGRKG